MSTAGAFRNPNPNCPLGADTFGIGVGYPPVTSGLGPASPVPYYDSPLMAAVTGSLVYPGLPQTALLAPPLPVSLTSATGAITGGSLAAGNYTYLVSALGPWGETVVSNPKVGNVASGVAGSVALVWAAAQAGTTGYKVYRYAGNYPSLLPMQTLPLAAVYLPGNVTSFTDTGANPPSYGMPMDESPWPVQDTTPPLDVDLGILHSPEFLLLTTSTTGGTGLVATTQYFYVVIAIGATGQTLGNFNFARTGGNGPLSEPSNELNVTTGAGATNSNTLTWAPVPEAVGYRVYRATATFTGGTTNTIPASAVAYDVGAVTSWTDTGATVAAAPATPGAALVNAPFGGSQFGALGNQGSASDKGSGAGRAAVAQFYRVAAIMGSSAAVPGEGIMSAEVTATPAAGQAVSVTWGAVSGAIGYRVFIGTATGVYGAFWDVGAVTTWVDAGFNLLNLCPTARARGTSDTFPGKMWAFLQTTGAVANGGTVATVGGIVFLNQTGVTVPTGKWLWAVQQ